MPEVTHILPDAPHGRRLIVLLGASWVSWGVMIAGWSVSCFTLEVLACVCSIAAAVAFFGSMFAIQSAAQGAAGCEALLASPFDVTWRALLCLFSLRWIRYTIRITGWNAKLVGFTLVGLLALDVTLYMTLVA